MINFVRIYKIKIMLKGFIEIQTESPYYKTLWVKVSDIVSIHEGKNGGVFFTMRDGNHYQTDYSLQEFLEKADQTDLR